MGSEDIKKRRRHVQEGEGSGGNSEEIISRRSRSVRRPSKQQSTGSSAEYFFCARMDGWMDGLIRMERVVKREREERLEESGALDGNKTEQKRRQQR